MSIRYKLPAIMTLIALVVVAVLIFKPQLTFFNNFGISIFITILTIIFLLLFLVTWLSSTLLLVRLVEHPLIRLVISVVVGILIFEILHFLNEWRFAIGISMGILCFIALMELSNKCASSKCNDEYH